jgi:hypothetical protein
MLRQTSASKLFWPLVEEYIRKDVDVLYEGLLRLDEQYKKIGYSVISLYGHSSIAFAHSNKFIPLRTFEPFTLELSNEWKECLIGGIVEVIDINKKQETVYKYDINGLYSYVRIAYDFPVGKYRCLKRR